MDSYEQWTRSEIARLKAEADKALSELDVLQRNFDKWLESQGRKNESRAQQKTEDIHSLNGNTPPRRGRRPGYGDKNATALKKIKAASSAGGLTTDELYKAFVDLFGPKYKRSSMRALLWHQKDLGNIEIRDGRYVTAAKGAAA
jgi:hypothetical protein